MSQFERKSVFVDFDKSDLQIRNAVSDYDRISGLVDKDLSINFNFLLNNYG